MTNAKNEQAALKAEYLNIIAAEVWNNDKGMLDFISKKISQIIKTSKGYLIPLDKPDIETRFCFGYSLSRYDTEDYDRANDMVDYANKNVEYFKSENLKKITEWIKAIENDEVYIHRHYCSSPANSRAKTLVHMHYYRLYDMTEEQKAEYELLTGADKETVLNAYKIELTKFEKRLNSYIKRYGTSKLRIWSYWRDE